MRTYGADLSHWEGIINWEQAVDYLPFAYYKCTDGEDFIDSQFGNNQDGCNDVGLPHAPYHWFQEQQDPIVQAEHFIETAGLDYGRYIVDVEPKVYYSQIYNVLMMLLGRVEALTGIIPAIYTSANYWNNYIRKPYNNRYPLLVAQYSYRLNPLLPNGATSWAIWQFTDYFWFHGCDATADGNWFNGSLQQCRDWFGNYKPYNQPPPVIGKTQMKVVSDWVYIREGPSTAYPYKGKLYKNDVIDVLDVYGTQAWVKHKLGWTAANYNGANYLDPA